jgi:hypothetical protein
MTRAVSAQRLHKHISAATNRSATIEVLLEKGISMWTLPRSYFEDKWGYQVKHKKLKLGGGQAYDPSNDQAAVVA